MLSQCEVKFLSSKTYKRKWETADKFLEEFITDYAQIYGEGYVSKHKHNKQPATCYCRGKAIWPSQHIVSIYF